MQIAHVCPFRPAPPSGVRTSVRPPGERGVKAPRRTSAPRADRGTSLHVMQQRHLGRTGLRVSRLALGTMTWGQGTDEHEARDQLMAFTEAGGTLIDTAAGYGEGASERLIGSFIGDVVAREDLVIATKAGISRRSGERVTDAARGTLLRTLDASLRRLGVDHVDLWQVHTWVDDTPLEETLSALDQAVSSGRAAYAGISNYSGWQTAQAATWQRAVPGRATLASTQVEYSLLNRRIETEVVPAAAALGLGILPWSPLGRGVLTGKYRTGTPTGSRGRVDRVRTLRRGLPRRTQCPCGRVRRPRRRGARVEPPRGGPHLGARPTGRSGAHRGRSHRGPAQGRPGCGTAHPAADDHRGPRRRVGGLSVAPRAERRAPGPRGGMGVPPTDDPARGLSQRGDPLPGREGRVRRVGAGPGAHHSRRHPPSRPTAQDHPTASGRRLRAGTSRVTGATAAVDQSLAGRGCRSLRRSTGCRPQRGS